MRRERSLRRLTIGILDKRRWKLQSKLLFSAVTTEKTVDCNINVMQNTIYYGSKNTYRSV
jgi:hypothetical protein